MTIDYSLLKYKFDSTLLNKYKGSMRGVCQKFRHIDQLYDLSILDEIVFTCHEKTGLKIIICIHKPCQNMSKMIKVSNDTMETTCCQKRYSLTLLQTLLYNSRFVIVSSLKEVEI